MQRAVQTAASWQKLPEAGLRATWEVGVATSPTPSLQSHYFPKNWVPWDFSKYFSPSLKKICVCVCVRASTRMCVMSSLQKAELNQITQYFFSAEVVTSAVKLKGEIKMVTCRFRNGVWSLEWFSFWNVLWEK